MRSHSWEGAAVVAASTLLCAALHAAPANAPEALPQISVTAKHLARKKPARRPAAAAALPHAPAPTASNTAPAIANPYATPPVVQRYQLPTQSFSTTAKRIEETVNLKDPEDAIKYFPSLFVRKRNDGDNQAVLATRTWGLASSARTLIYDDDLLVSALIGNNNSGASPHWNLVAPESIARIDFLNGPYAAAYPGNSMGGVLLITTKMPDKFEASVKETVSIQPWNQYDTKNTYPTTSTAMSVGNRDGKLSWLFSANYLDAFEQPLTYTTFSCPTSSPPTPTKVCTPAGTTGTITAFNKQGVYTGVVGTGALLHTEQTTMNFKAAYDIMPWLQASYSFGIWNNVEDSNPQTYLKSTTTGQPTFGGVSGFASNEYFWNQTHMSNAVSLKSDSKGMFDFDLSASSYNYLQDILINPYTVAGASTSAAYSQNGKITRNDGTNWQNVDAKGIVRPYGYDGSQEISFGVHGDRYYFNDPVYGSSVWNEASNGNGVVYSDGVGETNTGALWLQDAWKITSQVKLTLGGRLETWRAFDGFNMNTIYNSAGTTLTSSTAIEQPELHSSNLSPKASLSYDLNKDWSITTNFGEAYRYPTVTELYQNITVAGVATVANPNLTPEQDLNGEINIERHWDDGRVRLTGFYERTDNAIISQTNSVNGVPTTTIGNVQAIRMQGVEASADKDDVWFKGLRLFGSVTYVDSRILYDPTWDGTNPLTGVADTADGKRVPYVPDWRATAGFTYKPDDNWAWTVAARYSGKQYSTLDNTDVVSHVYGAFDAYFVVDTKIHYQAGKNVSFDFGIDNLFNDQYFLFHPFPGRTYVMAARYTF
jgi:iron complex outermembrane recepter protein